MLCVYILFTFISYGHAFFRTLTTYFLECFHLACTPVETQTRPPSNIHKRLFPMVEKRSNRWRWGEHYICVCMWVCVCEEDMSSIQVQEVGLKSRWIPHRKMGVKGKGHLRELALWRHNFWIRDGRTRCVKKSPSSKKSCLPVDLVQGSTETMSIGSAPRFFTYCWRITGKSLYNMGCLRNV